MVKGLAGETAAATTDALRRITHGRGEPPTDRAGSSMVPRGAGRGKVRVPTSERLEAVHRHIDNS